MREKDIASLLKARITFYTGKKITDDNMHLCDLDIPIENLLYIIVELDETYNLPIYALLSENDYTVFTVHNLAKGLATSTRN
ncbi:hypothetical protein NXH76_29125 [Blautia schinkii]|nr:hypothetical protein [Blautia schinkii]